MSRFDPQAYETAVIKPLRQWTGGKLPDDLLSRYAVEPGMSDAELAQRLAAVRSHWNKGAQSTGKSPRTQNLYKAFLRADEELKRTHGAQLGTIGWWRRHQQARAGARQGEIDELAATLRTSFGELGLITDGQLAATMRATSAALAPDEAAHALRKAGVSVSTPTELPRSSGLPPTVYRALRTQLADAQVATIAELLHGRLTGFAILESFRCTPGQPEGLTGKAVDSATARENKRSGNQAAREALGILSGAAKAALDLRKLTLFHLLDDVREHHRQGAPPTALLTQLHQARLDPAEARQAVFSVLHETVTSPATDLRTITELLAQGRLIAAQQALAALTDPEEATAAKDQVRRHADQVRRLREGAHESLRTGDEADARHRLRQAAVLATDDEDIAGELGRIPPPPVLEVSARLEGVGVRVSWRAPASHGEDTRYRVVRRRGRVPADPDDGTVLVNPLVGGEAATVLVDPRAPAGHLVGYAVFAATEEGVWSRPAGVSSEVLPPVHNVRLTAEQGSVEGHWQVNPDVLAVEVHRGAGLTGIAVPTASTTTFRDGVGTDGDDGADHVYTLVARYLRSDGSEARSAAVVARATSRGPALPVTGLRHQRLGPEVVLSWSWPEQAGTVEVRWRTPTDSGRYRLTRQRYLDAGGCRIRAGPDRLDVQVRSVVAAGGAERLSEAAELTVADLPPAVSYTVDMVRRPLIGGGTVRVRLTATQPVGHAVVLVVVAPGPVMPRRPTDGRVVLRSGLDLAAGHEVALRAELPRVRRPYWVRCFLEDSAGPRLIDPPTTQLKVS